MLEVKGKLTILLFKTQQHENWKETQISSLIVSKAIVLIKFLL